MVFFTCIYKRDAPAVDGPERERRLFPGSFTADEEQVAQGHDTWFYPPLPLCTQNLCIDRALGTRDGENNSVEMWHIKHVFVQIGKKKSRCGEAIRDAKMRSSETRCQIRAKIKKQRLGIIEPERRFAPDDKHQKNGKRSLADIIKSYIPHPDDQLGFGLVSQKYLKTKKEIGPDWHATTLIKAEPVDCSFG